MHFFFRKSGKIRSRCSYIFCEDPPRRIRFLLGECVSKTKIYRKYINMNTKIEIIESALNEHELHYKTASPGVIQLGMSGCTIAIVVEEENDFVKLLGYMSVGLEGDKVKEAYALLNQWNYEHITKYYIDKYGNLMVEWSMDTVEGAFNKEVFMAGFGRMAAALRYAKEPMMKLRYC